MKKFKEWLRKKLRDFLQVYMIEENMEKLSRDIYENSKKLFELQLECNKLVRDLENHSEAVHNFSKLLNGAVDIGMQKYHKNWAVFAIQGKEGTQDYVQFVDLSNLDHREVLEWVKRLESIGVDKKQLRYDAPMGVKDMFLRRW